MSKLTKLFKNPKLFFEDAKINKAAHAAAVHAPAPPKKPESTAKPQPVAAPKPQSIVKKPAKPAQISSGSKVRDDDLALAQKLLAFEAIYPVNNIDATHPLIYTQQLHIWPLLRHIFWVRSQALYKGKDPAKVNTTKMYISPEWRRHYSAVADVQDIVDIAAEPCDFLFFTNLRGTEQTKIDGKIYNRITDPVFEVAKTIGKSKKVEIVKSIGTVAASRFRFHPVDLLYPPELRKIGYFELLNFPENFLPRVQQFLPDIKVAIEQLRGELEFFFHQRDLYVEILKKYQPKIVFFVGFDYYYALVLAAKSLGIKTVDLQHGVQAGWSPVYNNWQALPVAGYGMLPDYFWVWGGYDEAKIKENFPVPGVQPIIGGFPWLERQKGFFSDDGNALEKFKRKNENDPLVGLITLQDQTEFPLLFSEIITMTAGKMRWIIKRHPKHLNINLKMVSGKSHHGKFFDDLSFVVLLKVVDIHLTECSTSVIDADYFGIPSVVTGIQGMLNYQDFIDKKQVLHVNSAQEFVERLPALLASKGASRMGVIDNDGTTERALRTLLDSQRYGAVSQPTPPFQENFSRKRKKR